MYIPFEILNIIFSYVEKPKSFLLIRDISNYYQKHININKETSTCKFHVFFFRLFLPIWKRWPENYLLAI